MNQEKRQIKNIRNFTIIAHVDHGKSTLADRLLMMCGAVSQREFQDQLLDNMSLERERGITIKAQTARLYYKHKGEDYVLNLIDTPGHSDFSYEVSRSLFACEISILLIDATKGVEAQTVSNFHKAKEAGHFILPVLNKVDLATADINRCFEDIDNLGLDIALIHEISAKTGNGIDKLIRSLIELCPCPTSNFNEPRALIIDSWYDKYLGVVTLVRIMDGKIRVNQQIKSHSNNREFSILKMGVFEPKIQPKEELSAGEIGFVVTQVKNSTEINVGDTFLELCSQALPIPGFKKTKPVVFCTFYPENPEDAGHVQESLKKYILNDSGFSFTIEHSDIYGMTFLCGFLGLLHLEIVKERLEREFNVFVVVTIPTVIYQVTLRNGEKIEVNNPNKFPEKNLIECMEEPEVICTIYTTKEVGKITSLCINRRAEAMEVSQKDDRFVILCRMPLAEIIVDFFDHLQSMSSGYASFEYEFLGYRKSELDKIMVIINGEVIKEFGLVVHESKARFIGKNLVEKLKEIIPRSQVAIKIQAAINHENNIIARSDISAFRKDVIAKCYGGDITRKKKLLEKQKKGKSGMENMSRNWILGRIPNNAIKDLLKFDLQIDDK